MAPQIPDAHQSASALRVGVGNRVQSLAFAKLGDGPPALGRLSVRIYVLRGDLAWRDPPQNGGSLLADIISLQFESLLLDILVF